MQICTHCDSHDTGKNVIEHYHKNTKSDAASEQWINTGLTSLISRPFHHPVLIACSMHKWKERAGIIHHAGDVNVYQDRQREGLLDERVYLSPLLAVLIYVLMCCKVKSCHSYRTKNADAILLNFVQVPLTPTPSFHL